MNWREQWQAISARIAGLSETARLLSEAGRVTGVKEKAKTVIGPELGALKSELEAFQSNYGTTLPPAANAALAEFLKGNWFVSNTNHPEVNLTSAAAFPSFRSRFEYLIRDQERDARSATELAFEHLQRLIAVDPQVKEKWSKAKDEPACEKLGAVHLLSHGIWAFKANSTGAATDLVYAEPIERFGEKIRRTARALVLTEWKRVRSQGEIEKKSAEAISQSADYAGGVLYDLELKGTRYVVLVGQEDQEPPPDRLTNGITYRHIWLGTNPQSASITARRRGQQASRRSASQGTKA